MMLRITLTRVARKPGRPGELEGNRKTIAQGMPVATGEPVALPRAFFCPNHGCIGHPAFPASSSLRGALRPLLFGANVDCKTRTNAVARTRSHIRLSFRGALLREPGIHSPRVHVLRETTAMPDIITGVMDSRPTPRGVPRNDELLYVPAF